MPSCSGAEGDAEFGAEGRGRGAVEHVEAVLYAAAGPQCRDATSVDLKGGDRLVYHLDAVSGDALALARAEKSMPWPRVKSVTSRE